MEFDVVAVVPIGDKLYSILTPTLKYTKSPKKYVFELIKGKKEDSLLSVENPEIIDLVYKEYQKQLDNI